MASLMLGVLFIMSGLAHLVVRRRD
ncbi:hypothetical protein [Listeria cornellensis]